MIWHMNLRLPWTWRLGPSNSSERGHVMEILEQEQFPEDTLFCGDAGFIGYDFWRAILAAEANFLVRVGGNVNLLSEKADIKRLGGGIVLCWPKGKMKSGAAPLRLRLVKVKIGKTTMWMLTSILEPKKLPKKKIIRYYKMRWGVEVEYRGLKQTIDKRNLRCRNSDRVYVELDWSGAQTPFGPVSWGSRPRLDADVAPRLQAVSRARASLRPEAIRISWSAETARPGFGANLMICV